MAEDEIKALRDLLITVVRLSPNRGAIIDGFAAAVTEARIALNAKETRSESESRIRGP